MVFAKDATKNKSYKFTMLKNIKRFIIVFVIFVSIVFTQSRIEGTGVGMDGSTGLFLNPSSETIGVGHIRLGSSHFISSQYQQLDKKIPFSISVGLTSRAELYYSTNTWLINSIEKEENDMLGLRIKMLNLNNSITSIDFRGQYIDILSGNKLLFEDRRIISRIITNFTLFNLKTHANIGYITSLESNVSNADNRVIGGIGVLFPIIKRVHGVIDFQVSEHESINNKINGSIALKWFLFNHIQLAGGFNTDIHGDEQFTGIFLNLSVSSEVMKGPGRRIRTRQGLPVPPKLPNNYFISEKKDDIIVDKKDVELQTEQYPLNIYVERYIENNYKNELPIVPPLNILDKWKEEVLININKKIITQPIVKAKDLPFPPPLTPLKKNQVSKSEEPKPRIKNVFEYLLDIETLTLPKPPSLDSLKK